MLQVITKTFSCRLCLTSYTILKSMFHCSIGSQNYAEIYEACTGFLVDGHQDLPKRICEECERNLIGFHNFRISLEDVEQRLQVYQSNLNAAYTGEEEEYFLYETIEEETFMSETELSDKVTQQKGNNESYEQDYDYNQTETECAFVAAKRNKVECVSCSDCEMEAIINKTKIDQSITVTCECGEIFQTRRTFFKHFSVAHLKEIATDSSDYKCRTCTETFRTWRSRVAHEANQHHVGLKFECSNCLKKFYRKDHWKDHDKFCNSKKNVDATLRKFLSCEVCQFVFHREDTYKKHLETAHITSTEDALTGKSDFSASTSSPSKGKICEICCKAFKNDLSLSKHTNLFHTNQVWSCDVCDAVFVHRSTKMSHMSREHGAKKPFECSQPGCGFSCFKRDRFNAHIEKHENPNKIFPCPICRQEFKSYNTMTLHRAKHSTSNQAYECLTCNKHFLDKRNFNVHLKLHTGKDLHHCPVCTRGFNRKDHLRKHQQRKSHYADNNEETSEISCSNELSA